MSIAKLSRSPKRQRGQFLTPSPLAEALVGRLKLSADTKVLEPSFGDGAFIQLLIRRLMGFHGGTKGERLRKTLEQNIYGVEIDQRLYKDCLRRIEDEFGSVPRRHNLARADFFRHDFLGEWHFSPATSTLTDLVAFDAVIGNPPFGGSFDPTIEDELDKQLGARNGLKIKKETYAFFIVKCVELLKPGGHLVFICSDTLLTIATMKGLRTFLMDQGSVTVERLPAFSSETNYSMVLLDFYRDGPSSFIVCDGALISRSTIELTGNRSWGISASFATLFDGPKVGDFMIGTSGMTIGKNDFFVRQIRDGHIEEPYWFEFEEERITLDGERRRARLGKLSKKQEAEIIKQETEGRTRRVVRVQKQDCPLRLEVPHPDYKPYNKSNGRIICAGPDHVIYWKDKGEAVLTFKKSGNWYLRGVGGQRFFEREGLTWSLVASSFRTRYLPAGYILDSGAPCGFLRLDVAEDELFFILGWTLSPLCNEILKSVINHTVNIQSKDFERLPYPHWVDSPRKQKAIKQVKSLISRAKAGEQFDLESPEIVELGRLFDFLPSAKRVPGTHPVKRSGLRTPSESLVE